MFGRANAWHISDATLRLINTRTYGWEPNAFGDNTLITRNSDYSGSSINSSTAKYIIENSIMGLTRTQESVEITVRDSVIRGHVVATDDSTITLVNSSLEREGGAGDNGPGAFGNVIATGNGTVVLINTVVQEEIRTKGNGQIIVQ